MFANYLIGLREGLEAALIVGILVAYLIRSGNSAALRGLWAGVGAAVTLSLGFGALLTYGVSELPDQAEEAIAGTLSILAVVFVTWMVFWMRRASRGLKAQLHGRLDAALEGGTFALVLTAFFAVGREGLETALFLWSAVQATGSGPAPMVGAALGLATAVALGYLIYRGALRLNLAVFFRWTGAALVLVAAGVLAHGVHDLQEAGVLPGSDTLVWNVSHVAILTTGVLATVLHAVLNFSPETTWLQWYTYSLYLVTALVVYFLVPVRARATVPAPAVSSPSVPVPAPAAPVPAGAAGARHRPS